VEEKAGVLIHVIPSVKQNGGGPTGRGKLAIDIDAKRIYLYAPTNDYFPDGAVRHELLHVQRFHVAGVPKLVLAEEEKWDQRFSDALGNLDNAIEHIVIVPIELQSNPERREHWEAVMANVCSDLLNAPKEERDLAVCLHWAFLQQALPDSPQVEVLKAFAMGHGLFEMAVAVAGQLLSALASKEDMVRILFLTFPYISRHRAELEYLSSTMGTRRATIP
jgi:hypothetical protein